MAVGVSMTLWALGYSLEMVLCRVSTAICSFPSFRAACAASLKDPIESIH